MSARLKITVAWTIAVTAVAEAVTLYLRFGRGQTAADFNQTAPLLLQIHHMFWGVPLLLLLPFVWRKPRVSGILLGVALGLAISDLVHHCLVLPQARWSDRWIQPHHACTQST
jgi:hypothetical protein